VFNPVYDVMYSAKQLCLSPGVLGKNKPADGELVPRASQTKARYSRMSIERWLCAATLFLVLISSNLVSAQPFSVIKTFGVAASVTGCNPACELVQDATGALYGTTSGEAGGTVFKLRTDGSGFQVLRMFTNAPDGTVPWGTLTLDGSTLYGVTARGGSSDCGTLFSMGLDGSAFTVLKSFSSSDGWPQGNLTFSGGTLFGVLQSLALQGGTIFRVQTNGTGYTVLKRFRFFDNVTPRGRLLVSGTTLYGTITPSFFAGSAAVFSIGTDGSGYSIVRSFSLSDGDPTAGLTLSGGTLYGVTDFGGTYGAGTVFKMSTNGSGYTVLKALDPQFTGPEWPSGPLATDGSVLYGVTRWGGAGLGTLFKVGTNGTGYAMLDFFRPATGDPPQAGLLVSGSMLYGTAYQDGNLGCGTVFKISTGGSGLTVLKHFGYSDAAAPYGALLPQGAELYGTSSAGGSSGRGTVFKVNRDGTGYTVLKNFSGYADGANPQSGLVSSGNVFYGTTTTGGSFGYGTVFSMSTDGSAYTVLRSFAASEAGSNPNAATLLVQDGVLYGTTYTGGASNLGSVFRLSTNGADYSILNSFQGGNDGANPYSQLIGIGDWLYGTTYSGGVSNAGTIFCLNKDGSGYTVLKQFAAGNDGTAPYGGFVTDGTVLYGTTSRGGASDSGTVFKLNTKGTGYTVLKHLTSAGSIPKASLVLSGTTLYGITSTGGGGNGVIFSLRTDGTGFAILKALSGTDGSATYSGLVHVGGTLIGSTFNGGQLQDGTIFGLAVPPQWTVSTPPGTPNTPFSAFISGIAGSTVAIEASSDLSNWVRLQTNLLGGEPLYFSDRGSCTSDRRFYRAVALP
jgi:uncharacterized repeat protein (TIGR03803 family)